MTNKLTLIQPDDWHCHLREGAALARTVADTAKQFARAIVMPNLSQPVTTVTEAQAYYADIQRMIPASSHFQPLMTLYLTDNTQPEDIKLAKQSGCVYAVKYYPKQATTNSSFGVTDITKLDAVLECMQAHQMPLLIHGEVVDAHVDIFAREAVFIDTVLTAILKRFPQLKVVLEHISTAYAVEFVKANPGLGATITAHHLLINRNHLLVGGIKPHYYCLPVCKTLDDQHALIAAATAATPQFFLGTDSAPHARSTKEAACGCAGIYTAYSAMELYAEVFEQAGCLANLEAFASLNGPRFYGLPVNTSTVTLVKQPWTMPKQLDFADTTLVPFRAGQSLAWRFV